MRKKLALVVMALFFCLSLIGCDAYSGEIIPIANSYENFKSYTEYAYTKKLSLDTPAQSSLAIEFLPLIFNAVNIQEGPHIQVSPMPSAFHHELTAEQLNRVFPYFYLPLIATAEYEADGSFIEVVVSLNFSDIDSWVRWARIYIGMGGIRFDTGGPVFERGLGLGLPRDLEESYVHGTMVRTVIGDSGRGDTKHFQSEFEIGDIFFRVKFEYYEEPGKELITAIVNKLILGGIEGIASLADPEIPELRSEAISLAESRLDPDFGRFVPSEPPVPFRFSSGHRSINQHWNTLFLEWVASQNEDYLINLYEEWVDWRTSSMPPFGFDNIFWGEYSVRWQISKATEYDLSRIRRILSRCLENFKKTRQGVSCALSAGVCARLNDYASKK